MSKITFEDKEDVRESSVPNKNKITAKDMNEVKSVVNENENLNSKTIELNKSQINDLHNTPIVVDASELKLGDGGLIYISHVTVEKFRDGVDFSTTIGGGIQAGNNVIQRFAANQTVINESSDKKYITSFNDQRQYLYYELPITNEIKLITNQEISGGGNDCFIKVKVFYKTLYL